MNGGTLWSDEEICILDALFRSKHSISTIAKQLNRSPRAVLHKLAKYELPSVCDCASNCASNCSDGCNGDGGYEGECDNDDTYVSHLNTEHMLSYSNRLYKMYFVIGAVTGAIVSLGSMVFVTILYTNLQTMV
jgi:hypothetical protein